jgi:hypothetical protein
VRAVALAVVLVTALAAEARADRFRYFPTASVAIDLPTEDEDNLLLCGWVGVGVQPTKGTRGIFWAAGVEIQEEVDRVTFMPVARVGGAFYTKENAWIPWGTAYLITGLGDGEVRIGAGFSSALVLLIGAAGGIALPSVFELVADIGRDEAQGVFRLGWGF